MDEFTGWFQDALIPYQGKRLEFSQRPHEIERKASIERSTRRTKARKERRR